MTPEEIAALGARKGEGESLASWLRGSPLDRKRNGWLNQLIRDEHLLGDDAYCPDCVIHEQGRWRWYSREEWSDPRQVVCSIHVLPLARAEVPPVRRWTVNCSPQMRDQMMGLGAWLSHWIRENPCRRNGRLTLTRGCLEDLLLLALTKPLPMRQGPQAAALAQWWLWSEGWPVPARPRGEIRYQLVSMEHQVDRLALIAAVWKLKTQLRGDGATNWPALPVAGDILRCLLCHSECAKDMSVSRLHRAFTPVERQDS